ncbi:MAG: c-type cytochrome [Pseudomarimonas sp.]
MADSPLKALPAGALMFLSLVSGSSTATSLTPPPKLGLCASCHNENGMATLPAHPHLAGQDAEYLRLALAKYKTGERDHAPMRAAVSALSQADLDRIVDYYAALPHAPAQSTGSHQ